MKKKVAIVALSAAALAVAMAPAANASTGGSECYFKPRGCVSVRGHFEPSTGTYVSPYRRSHPSTRTYRTPSSRTPSYGSSYRSWSNDPRDALLAEYGIYL